MRTHRNARHAPARFAGIGRRWSILGWVLVLVLAVSHSTGQARPQKSSAPIKIAVFDFELEDVTPAASYLNQATSSAASLERASSAARQELAASGHYQVVDAGGAQGRPPSSKALRDCEGCEAGMARKLGADESMIGIVRRATQTDYYVTVIIRDARTGKMLDEQGANFAGGEEGWASGARILIRHQVLVSPP